MSDRKVIGILSLYFPFPPLFHLHFPGLNEPPVCDATLDQFYPGEGGVNGRVDPRRR